MLPKIKKIIYATGLGPAAPYVFRHTLGMARQYGAEIIAVHGMEPLSTFGQSMVELYISHDRLEELHEGARQEVRNRLRERIERICEMERANDPDGVNRVSEIRIAEGQPAQVVLAAAADCGADLIVMGSHRHTVLGEALLGTTTTKVLHATDRPVLVVRIPEGFREEGF